MAIPLGSHARIVILCSSGVLFRPEVFDTDSILEFGPQLPVDGLEVLVTRRMVGHLAEVGSRLAQSGLSFPVVHAPKRAGAALPSPDGIEQLEEATRFAATIGAELVVLHLWDLPDSDSDLGGRIEAAVLAADVVGQHGRLLAIETIPCVHNTPLANVQRVLDGEPRVTVTLDTEFLAFHDELDAALQARWLWDDGFVRHIHLKDYAEGLFHPSGARRYLLPGEGSIDFPSVFRSLEANGFSGSVALEAPALFADGTPDVAGLSRSLARISQGPWRFE